MIKHIRIGSRGSKLALIHTDLVVSKIKQIFPDIECEIVPIITTGDKIKNINLYDIGGKALFLKEIEEELVAGNIDIAVHSLKDIPGVMPDELSIAAVLEREDPRDTFVSIKYRSIKDLPEGATFGTSSPRRKVIIEKVRPDIKIVQFRGNVDTRMEKLENNVADATILAQAGLLRVGLFNDKYCHPLNVDEMLPSAGQGIVAIEIKKGNEELEELCKKINHMPTWHLALAERSFLKFVDASCRTPLAAHAVYKDGKILAKYMISDFEGSFMFYHQEIDFINAAEQMGIRAGQKMLKQII